MSITLEDIQALLDANNEVLKAQRAEERAELVASFDEKIGSIEIPPAYVPPEPQEPAEGEESPAMLALMARHEADMSGLSDSDKALISAIGGEDILSQSKAFSQLQKAGKFKKAEDSTVKVEAKPKKEENTPPIDVPEENLTKPPAVKPPTRLSLSSSSEKPKPKTWEEAGQRTVEAMQKIRTT